MDRPKRASLALIGAVLLAPGCATLGTPPVREARVTSCDSAGFFRQPDGAWIEFSNAGLPRFRFVHERDEPGGVSIVFDETRHVRLRVDPHAMTITEEVPNGWRPLYMISQIVRGPLSVDRAVASQPSAGVTRAWFVDGGAFVRHGDAWLELSPVDGFPIEAHWRERSRDAENIALIDEERHLLANVHLSRAVIDLTIGPDVVQPAHWRIRAVDHF